MDAQSAMQALVGMSDRGRRGVESSLEGNGETVSVGHPRARIKNLHMAQMSSHLGSW